MADGQLVVNHLATHAGELTVALAVARAERDTHLNTIAERDATIRTLRTRNAELEWELTDLRSGADSDSDSDTSTTPVVDSPAADDIT